MNTNANSFCTPTKMTKVIGEKGTSVPNQDIDTGEDGEVDCVNDNVEGVLKKILDERKSQPLTQIRKVVLTRKNTKNKYRLKGLL